MTQWPEDEEGYFTWQVCFENVGAFSARCPGCGRRMAADGFKVLWNQFREDYKASAQCKRCGEVEPVHLAWPGEFEKDE